MSGHVEITITETDIKKTLLHYNYGSYISHENISFGYANENFKVTTTTGNILFRLYKIQSEDSVRQELLLMNALQNSGFPTAYPLVDNSGAYIRSINNHSCILSEFIEGIHPIPNQYMAGEIGRAIGTLSVLPINEKYKRPNYISIEHCLTIIQEFPKAKYQHPEIFDYFKVQTTFLKNYISKELPMGIVHGDCFPDNTLFNDNKLIAIIDFEDFAFDTLLFDLGMSINGFCYKDNMIQTDLMHELIKEYESVRKLNNKEKELLPYYIQWAAHGMIYWHLRNNLLYAKNQIQLKRVEEFMNRVKTLKGKSLKWN